MRYLLTAIG